ncbi:hypothetical protein Mapa_003955 [Marchantia paleacea]|nr:hypothetical protein Mapa_003955 [Marchantia paleacea]
MGYSDHRDGLLFQPIMMPRDATSEHQFRKKPWRRVCGVSRSMKQVDVKAPIVQTLKSVPCFRNKARGRHNKFKYRFSKRRVPCAPRNTTSFIMRANKFGIKAPFYTPLCPTTVGTPTISPAPWPKETLGDGQVASDLGVNAYGSMNGCIRLKADAEDFDVEGERDLGSTSCNESDTDQCSFQPASSVQQVEERIDHCLQRFELLSSSNNTNHFARTNFSNQSLVAKVEDQENHINYLEEVNMSLHQQLWAIQQELTELRRRLANDRTGSEIVVTDESLGDGSCAA